MCRYKLHSFVARQRARLLVVDRYVLRLVQLNRTTAMRADAKKYSKELSGFLFAYSCLSFHLPASGNCKVCNKNESEGKRGSATNL